MNTNVKTAGKTLELLRPLPVGQLMREGVKSYVDAQKALMDVMLKHRGGRKHEVKAARRAKRPPRPVRKHAAAAAAATA